MSLATEYLQTLRLKKQNTIRELQREIDLIDQAILETGSTPLKAGPDVQRLPENKEELRAFTADAISHIGNTAPVKKIHTKKGGYKRSPDWIGLLDDIISFIDQHPKETYTCQEITDRLKERHSHYSELSNASVNSRLCQLRELKMIDFTQDGRTFYYSRLKEATLRNAS